MSDDNPIKISMDEVERVTLPQASVNPQAGSAPKSYGTLAIGQPGEARGGGRFWLRAWVYLGFAGLTGAILVWAICEPFIDVVTRVVKTPRGDMTFIGDSFHGVATVQFVLLVVVMCLGFAAAESLVERSLQKALQRIVVAIILGIVLGYLLDLLSNLVFRVLYPDVTQNPDASLAAKMAGRSVAWAIFGVVAGVVYGLAGRSTKKCLYGVIGGVIGAFIGGALFDPIAQFTMQMHLTRAGGASRAIGYAFYAVSTGVAMGLVESALKDRWLYVAGGPLAGKQFILYKQETIFGSQQSADIYLFKDPSILAEHAVLSMRGRQASFRAIGTVAVNGQPVQETTLRSGDHIQIGRYTFEYQEKQKAS